MKNTMIALATVGLISFGSAAQAGDATAGQAAYATCIGCHGAAGEGGVGPKLAGQAAADVAAKLHAYKKGEQVGPMTSMMAPMAAGLSDADIDNIAAYTASM
ncbi:MAG: c-type cytochrome [Thiotrichales bacterium]|nr:c-type cytochrome [Thiotrichales bacterium]